MRISSRDGLSNSRLETDNSKKESSRSLEWVVHGFARFPCTRNVNGRAPRFEPAGRAGAAPARRIPRDAALTREAELEGLLVVVGAHGQSRPNAMRTAAGSGVN